MLKLLLVFLINIIQLATSSADVPLIYGPATPIYYPELVGDGMKVRMVKNKFPSRPANYSDDEAIHLKLLFIFDYGLRKRDTESEDIDEAIKKIESINSDYRKVNSHPRVEVILAGIVIMTDENIFPKAPLINGPIIIAKDELERFNDWWKSNEDQFEDLDYHAFYYYVPYLFIKESAQKMTDYSAMFSFSNGRVCQSKPGAIVVRSTVQGWTVEELSYMLGVTHEQDRDYYHWYTALIFPRYLSLGELWRNQTAKVVTENYRKNKYSCLKKSNDYDYDEH